MVGVAKFLPMAFLVVFGLVVFVRLLNGQIATSSALADAIGNPTMLSRLQLLVASIFGGSLYFFSILESSGPTLPEVPNLVLALIAASNGSYLGVKIYIRVMRKP